MKNNLAVKIAIFFILVMIFVIGGSYLSVKIWGGKSEKTSKVEKLNFNNSMTVDEFGKANNLSNETLKKIFGLTSKSDLKKKIYEFNFSEEILLKKVNKAIAISAEESSKNWIKIFIKFGLWAIFLVIVYTLLKREKITPKLRILLLFIAFTLFGITLGSDPSPMGTVKDAIVLFGRNKVIFIPRLVSLSVMLIGGVLLANKFICSWGCQFGTLQDFIFRLNRNKKDQKGFFPQIKIPFFITNSIRILFFIALTAVAFIWATDIIEPIDPFKIFKPTALGIAGIVFIAVILILSLFTYRPWCHFFCPFGLVGWIIEKISLNKIHVDYNKCIACYICSKSCPSNVMDAILKRNKIIPDCFSCGTCIDSCPTNAISFKSGKRARPPEGKFK